MDRVRAWLIRANYRRSSRVCDDDARRPFARGTRTPVRDYRGAGLRAACPANFLCNDVETRVVVVAKPCAGDRVALIGVVLDASHLTPTVLAAVPNRVAAKAGSKPGDVIVAVDGARSPG